MGKKILAVVFVVGMWVVIIALTTHCCYPHCPGYEKQRGGLGQYIAISPDDSEILFSWYKKGKASLYAADANGCNVRRVTKAKRESHIGAAYSPDGSKIIYLAYREKRGRPYSTLCVMDANGLNIHRLTSGKEHITEAIFSPDGNTIYYLESHFFGHYSPIACSRPHEFDIYSINVDGTGGRRLTDRKEYDMYGLSITGNGRWLAFCKYQNPPAESFCVLDLENTDEELQYVSPSGQFHLDGLVISDLCLSPYGGVAAFVAIAPTTGLASGEVGGYKYELYLMDLESKRSERLTNLRRLVSSPRFMSNQARIIFTVNSTWPNLKEIRYELWAVNTDGTELSEIKLEGTDR